MLKKMFLKVLQNSDENTSVTNPLLNKIAR